MIASDLLILERFKYFTLFFSTSLNNDNSISESSNNVRKVSRRHPVISLDNNADLKKIALLKSGKHKLDDDGDDVEEDKGATSENKRFKKVRQQTASDSGRSNMPGCSKDSQKFLSAVSSTSSDNESRSSDASRKSRNFKKDSNNKVRFAPSDRLLITILIL